jgi:dTDP-4-dehydrorhamnose reductase
MKTKILVTGANGQLAKCIKGLEANFLNFKISFKNSSELDITNPNQVNDVFKNNRFDWCINCAAYTNVEKAEIETEKAFNINQLGIKNIALACRDYNTKLIHVSTDFVFDGKASEAYTEKDEPNPINVYGLSKLKGEKELQSILNEYFIVRTSWLYSKYGSNFLTTMLKLAETKSEINVVSDQIGTPTYAMDLASFVLNIIKLDAKKYGIYNYSNQGETSWYDFASEIFKTCKASTKVKPITSSNYPTLVKRPKFSVLDKTKIKNTFNISIPHWKDSLEIAIKNLNG